MRRAILACFALCATAALAGNMSVAIDTLPAVQLSGFATGGSNVGSIASGGGSGAGKVTFKEFSFKATQSAATPKLMLLMSQGKHIPNVKVQVRTPDGARLSTEWQLSDALVSAVDVTHGEADPKAKGPDFFMAPETTFSLQFRKYCYKVFAADGTTVASQMCWDLATNSGG
jgi:type VI protein secretion system component Hcp